MTGLEWPIDCQGCGSVYESPDDEDVFEYRANGGGGRRMRAFVCLNCVEPKVFSESRTMKKFLAWWNKRSASEGFLGYVDVTDDGKFLEK